MFYINFINQCAKLNVTPAKVAREIGVSGAAVSKWKNGSKPSDVTLAKLAEYFGVTVDDLLADAENEQTKKARDALLCLSVAYLRRSGYKHYWSRLRRDKGDRKHCRKER